MASRLRGLIADASGDEIAHTSVLLAEASELFQGLTMPFEAALADLDHGAALRRAGKRREAAARLYGGGAVFGRLDARPYLARTEAELASCGRRRQPAGTAAGQGAGRAALTPAESAVLDPGARGRQQPRGGGLTRAQCAHGRAPRRPDLRQVGRVLAWRTVGPPRQTAVSLGVRPGRRNVG